jgi:hypothetical protein
MSAPSDLTAYLQQRREALRAVFTVRPLRPDEIQRLEDIHWAQDDPEVQALYEGEFVVPYNRQIVSHGCEATQVLAEAARVTGRPVEELPLVGVISPLRDMPLDPL